MARRRIVNTLVMGLLVGACSTGHTDSTVAPIRPEPAVAATGPVVRSLIIGETSFALHDEDDGCLAVEITQPGLQPTVERHCFEGDNVLTLSSECGWLVRPALATTTGCDLILPQVLYGQVRSPDIGYVCLGTLRPPYGEEGVVSARLVSPDEAGFILDSAGPDESSVAHLFTPGGLRYGFPPLDAPSNPIYTFCEDQAPWGTTEYHVPTRVFVALGDSLRTDDVIIIVDSGTGPMGLSGSAASGGGAVDLPMEVGVSSPGLSITIEQTGRAPIEFFRPWPEAVRAILDSGLPCRLSMEVRLTLADSALTGSEAGVALALSQNLCGY